MHECMRAYVCMCAYTYTRACAPSSPCQPELFLVCWRLVFSGFSVSVSNTMGCLGFPPSFLSFLRTRKPNQEAVMLPRDTEEEKTWLVSGGREKVRSLITQVKLTPPPNPHAGFPLTSETFPSKPPTPRAVSGPRWMGEAPPPTAGSGSRGVQDCGLL